MVAASTALSNVQFDYCLLPINDMSVETKPDTKTGRLKVEAVMVNDEPLLPSQRFWTSLFARFGFNKSFFTYFTHAEVFDRIAHGGVDGTATSDAMRLCIERKTDEDGNLISTLMGVSSPSNPVVEFPALVEQLDRYNGQSVDYANGEIYSTHAPRVGAGNFDVCGDTFSNRFVMATPIDGYGKPNFYLSLLRQVCSNGMIGYAKAFKSALNLGKASDDVIPTITRALDGFGNDEGFAALRQRIEASTQSWCSVAEAQKLYKLITRLHSGSQLPGQDRLLTRATNLNGYMLDKAQVSTLSGDVEAACPSLTAFHKMTGDINETYGLANVDALSMKRQATLPCNCTVYDLINFSTELATHYATADGARQLHAMVGTLISNEYDMEGTKQEFDDFADFLIDSRIKAGVTGSEPVVN
jgi:hypothetical protein